ncbi:hypothetical protein G6F22_020304 [Rhizopus arrhizus]|nr:hypothetical protein G6F22_020304 [Rhizopus arrhizus]
MDRGFVVSDHADWPDLLRTIHDTGARRVIATHGDTDALVRTLNEAGVAAETLATQRKDHQRAPQDCGRGRIARVDRGSLRYGALARRCEL